MNLDELIKIAEEKKEKIFKELDDLKLDIDRIEKAIKGLPIPSNFRYSVADENDVIGDLYVKNDRICFYWSVMTGQEDKTLRPLIEFPIDVRLLCKKHLMDFFSHLLACSTRDLK